MQKSVMMQNWSAFYTIAPTSSIIGLKLVGYLLDAGHKMFRRRPRPFLIVLCAFNLCPVSKRIDLWVCQIKIKSRLKILQKN